MAEFLKGKQPTKHLNPSRLSIVHHAPDSDTIVSETQLEADEYGIGDHDFDDEETLACVEKNSVNKSAGTVRISSQTSTFPSHALLVRPTSATTEVFNPFARRAHNLTPPKEDASAVKPSIYPDTATPSTESPGNGTHEQGAHASPVPPSMLPSFIIEERVAVETSKQVEAAHDHDQSQPRHTEAPTAEALRTKPNQTESLRVSIEPQTTLQSITKPASVPKKKRSGTKAKKVKKPLLHRPLVPWPPRSGPASDQSNTQPAVIPPTQQVTHEPKPEAGQSPRSIENLSVKFQLGEVSIPDKPLEFEEASFAAKTASPLDAADGSPAANELRAMPSLRTKQPEIGKPLAHFDAEVRELVDIADSSIVSHDSSPLASYEAHNQYSQAQQDLILNSQAPDNSMPVSGSVASLHDITTRSHPFLKPNSTLHTSYPVQQNPSSTETANPNSPDGPTSHSKNVQGVLHGVTSRSGPTRVTKTLKRAQTTHIINPKTTAGTGHLQAYPRMTALDVAWNMLRTAYIADQDRLTLTTNELNEEKAQLQVTIIKQQETIAEQRAQLKQSDERLVQLSDKVRSSQKYVAGLQKDHERSQKSAVTFHEQNKRVLQDQLAQAAKEKEEMQKALESTIDSCAKSQKSMLRTMNEIQLRYVTALSREHDMKDRLHERIAMHEEEKNRRTGLEQRLVPFVQGIQRQLNESYATLFEKIGNLHASLEGQAKEDGSFSTARECLLVLQKLQSLPLLTSNDIRKAEGMLRYLHERTDAGFELVAKTSEGKPFPIEDIRQCIRDQIQDLQAGILRHDHAIADGKLTHERNQSLRAEVDIEKQKNQRLEEQVSQLQQSEAALKSSVTELENERVELQTADREREAQAREFEVKITQLQGQLSGIENDLRLSNDNVKRHERRQLEQERQFCTYRVDALAQLATLGEHIQQMTHRLQVKDRQCNALEEDAADLRIKLESEQTKNYQLTIKTFQCSSTMETLRQDMNDAAKEEGKTRASLRSAQDSILELETENRKLSSSLEETRTDSRDTKCAEQKLIARYSKLQQELSQLREAKLASDEQLRQAQNDMNLGLQQAKTDYTAELEDLSSRLTLSEDAHRESQAKLRHMETAHKQQIECHEQKFIAKFDSLASQSQLEQEKLKAKHMQEMENCKQDAEKIIATVKLDTENLLKEADTRIDDMVLETERRLVAAGLPTGTILVPNMQQSEENRGLSSQKLQPGRTRKKVDRQTNSVTVVVASSNRSSNTAEGGFAIDRAAISDRRREGSQNQLGFFEEEYENRFGFQVPLQDQEIQLPLVDPEAEVVLETQDFEYGQGVPAQFGMIESQAIVSDNVNQEENLTDLSTMPSEDLSEMLLDIQPTARGQLYTSKHLSSPSNRIQTPGRSADDMASDAASTNSRGRPKSRANTASRMMPLPAQDMQRQRAHADEGPQRSSYARAERSFEADNNDSPDSMHVDHATSKRTYAQRSLNGTDSGHKHKSASSRDDDNSFKKLRTSGQTFLSSISKSYAPYTPAPTSTPTQNNSKPSSARVTNRRSSHRQSSTAGSQGATPRLSSTRNTRSKSKLASS